MSNKSLSCNSPTSVSFIFKSINDFPNPAPTGATVGTFDGLHAGHQMILERIKNRAKEISGLSVLISFDPHPRRLVHPEYPLQLLTSIDERSELLSKMGLDYLIVQNFNEDFAKIESIEFVRNFLIEKIGARKMYSAFIIKKI